MTKAVHYHYHFSTANSVRKLYTEDDLKGIQSDCQGDGIDTWQARSDCYAEKLNEIVPRKEERKYWIQILCRCEGDQKQDCIDNANSQFTD